MKIPLGVVEINEYQKRLGLGEPDLVLPPTAALERLRVAKGIKAAIEPWSGYIAPQTFDKGSLPPVLPVRTGYGRRLEHLSNTCESYFRSLQ
ncbi:MAG: hypothetical protein ACRDGA_01030 [Bacteroidota bacterium]